MEGFACSSHGCSIEEEISRYIMKKLKIEQNLERQEVVQGELFIF